MTIILERETNNNDVLLYPAEVDNAEIDGLASLQPMALENKKVRNEEEDNKSPGRSSLYGGITSYESPQFDSAYVEDTFQEMLDLQLFSDEDEDQILMDALKTNERPIVSAFIDDSNHAWSSQSPCRELRLALLEKHIGNNRFYIMLSILRQNFMEAFHLGNRAECDEILKQVIDSVCCSNPPGRFLVYTSLDSGLDEGLTDIGQCQATMQRVEAAILNPPVVALSQFLYHEHDIASGAQFMSDSFSTDVTLPIDYSMTVSSPSIRKSCVSSSNMESCIETSYMGTESQFGNETSSILSTWQEPNDTIMEDSKPGGKRRKNGMRRRGLITSDMPSEKIDKMNHYEIGKDLEKLVQNVFFDSPTENGDTRDWELASNHSDSSDDDRSKRVKRSVTVQSMCSSTSSLGGLRADFAKDLRIDSLSRPKFAKRSRRRKTPLANSSHVVASEDKDYNPRIKVKFFDEGICTTRFRPLSSYDVLCTNEIRPIIKQCNHVGNNRFRTMLMIFQARYNSKDITLQYKNQLVRCILQHTLYGEKGQTRFVFQEQSKVWTQIPNEAVPKIIVACLEECSCNPGLCVLPLFTEDIFLRNSNSRHQRQEGRMTIKDLRKMSLDNIIQKRKKKKSPTRRDRISIEQLQETVKKLLE